MEGEACVSGERDSDKETHKAESEGNDAQLVSKRPSPWTHASSQDLRSKLTR